MHDSHVKVLLREGEFGAAGRQLGRDLAAENPGDLSSLERDLTQLQQAPPLADEGHDEKDAESFARGFLHALAMVAHGFESERRHRADEESLMVAARTRSHWKTVLGALRAGCSTPQEIV